MRTHTGKKQRDVCHKEFSAQAIRVKAILVENTTFDNNVVNFILNVTKFGMLIDIIDVDKSYDFGCYGNHFSVYYEFLIYQNVCIYKMAWFSINS